MSIYSDRLVQVQADLVKLRTARDLILTGAQEYSRDNRTLVRPNLKDIMSEIKRLEAEETQLLQNGMGLSIRQAVPRDI